MILDAYKPSSRIINAIHGLWMVRAVPALYWLAGCAAGDSPCDFDLDLAISHGTGFGVVIIVKTQPKAVPL